ncbi:MAG: hypothetical protein HY829_14375, partial [Actinobacteria bacterium]|nr:hypothetical protein [Actinomycetota bacterium]
GVLGQATTWGVPRATGWSQPGQRYGFVAAAPGTLRTIHRPSLFTTLVA